MTEVVCVRIRLRDDALPLVEEWARTLSERKDEVLATLREEGVVVESAFLDESDDGPHVVYYMRAESVEKAYAVGRRLQDPIQLYHEEFKRKAFGERRELRKLIDFER